MAEPNTAPVYTGTSVLPENPKARNIHASSLPVVPTQAEVNTSPNSPQPVENSASKPVTKSPNRRYAGAVGPNTIGKTKYPPQTLIILGTESAGGEEYRVGWMGPEDFKAGRLKDGALNAKVARRCFGKSLVFKDEAKAKACADQSYKEKFEELYKQKRARLPKSLDENEADTQARTFADRELEGNIKIKHLPVRWTA